MVMITAEHNIDGQRYMRLMSNSLGVTEYLDYVISVDDWDDDLPYGNNDELDALLSMVSKPTSVPVIKGKEYKYDVEISTLTGGNHVCVYREHLSYFFHQLLSREADCGERLLKTYTFACTESKSDPRVVHVRKRVGQPKSSTVQAFASCHEINSTVQSKQDGGSFTGTINVPENPLAGVAPVSYGKEEDLMKGYNVRIGMLVQNKHSRRIAVVTEMIGNTSVSIVYGDNTRELIGCDSIRSCHKAFVVGGLYLHRETDDVYKINYDGVIDELVMQYTGNLKEFAGGVKSNIRRTKMVAEESIESYEPLLVVTDDPASIPAWAIS